MKVQRTNTDVWRGGGMDVRQNPDPSQPPLKRGGAYPTFGIYVKTRKTPYGHCDIGKYKGNNVEIYHDHKENTKLYYISDNVRRWIKSKLVYWQNGIKKIVRSEAGEKR